MHQKLKKNLTRLLNNVIIFKFHHPFVLVYSLKILKIWIKNKPIRVNYEAHQLKWYDHSDGPEDAVMRNGTFLGYCLEAWRHDMLRDAFFVCKEISAYCENYIHIVQPPEMTHVLIVVLATGGVQCEFQ